MRLSSGSLLSPGCAALDIAVGASEPPLLHLVEGEGSIGNKSTCRTAAKVKWLKSTKRTWFSLELQTVSYYWSLKCGKKSTRLKKR